MHRMEKESEVFHLCLFLKGRTQSTEHLERWEARLCARSDQQTTQYNRPRSGVLQKYGGILTFKH